MIGKYKVYHENFPKILSMKKTSIADKNVIAGKFNEVFVNVGSNLTTKYHLLINILVISSKCFYYFC